MSLRQVAFSAGRWTTTSLLTRALLQFIQIMVLARLLTPADFGTMAIISATYTIISLFVDLGLSNALIHFPEPRPSVLSTLYWLNLGAAVLMSLIFVALAGPIARLYHQPELFPAMLTMSLAMPLGALGQQFRVLAEKELRFTALAIIEATSALCGFAGALLVAWLQGGVYAFIAGVLASAGASSSLAWLFLSAGKRPRFHFDLGAVSSYLRYGAYRLGDALLNSLQSQADLLIGGAVAGSTAMGAYAVTRDLALRLANTLINPVVTRVGLPVMAKVQADSAALKSVYLPTLRVTSSVNFPIYTALAVWANDLVIIFLGNQWHEAGYYLRLFALWGLIRSVGNPVGSLLYATGHVRRAFWWNLSLLAIVPVTLWLSARSGGLSGLAWMMLGTQIAIFYPVFRCLVKPICGASFGEYAGALVPPLAASAVAAASGLAVSSLFPQDMRLGVTCGGTAFAIAYLGVSLALNKPWIDAVVEFLSPVLKRAR